MTKTKRKRNAFERSRQQIVVVIMAVFLLLFTITLAAIYIVSYRELYQENQDMLEVYIEQYRENGNPSQIESIEELPQDDNPPKSEDSLPDHENTRFLLSSFYSAAFDEDQQAFSFDLGDGSLYTESQILEVASQILESGKEKGTFGNFIYCIDTEESYTLVVLMDNTLIEDSFTTLFRNALLLGVVMVIVLLLCAVALARWIIQPLEENDRRQQQFIADASHELKTPVSVVEANAEVLQREIGENKWLQNIRSESSRMAVLINEMLNLTRTQQQQPQMEPVDFSRLVLGGILPFESVAFEEGRELKCEIADDITIYGNSVQLSQLVSILMDNALSHCSGEGDITITLQQEKSETVLTISNPGFIPEKDREEIFARFYKRDANRSDTKH